MQCSRDQCVHILLSTGHVERWVEQQATGFLQLRVHFERYGREYCIKELCIAINPLTNQDWAVRAPRYYEYQTTRVLRGMLLGLRRRQIEVRLRWPDLDWSEGSDEE